MQLIDLIRCEAVSQRRCLMQDTADYILNGDHLVGHAAGSSGSETLRRRFGVVKERIQAECCQNGRR